jgi:hypothetical protein
MSTLVDRMVTEYVLDSRGYSAGTQNVVRDSHRAGQAIDHAKGKTQGLGVSMSGFMGGISSIIGTAVAALTAAGGAVAGLGIYAMKTAADFDTLQRTLTAVTGSAERAKEILAFVDELAVPSIFGTADLADAAKTLEAFGLNTEKYLPVVEKLGTVFGGSAEKLDQFVRALGYIKGGRFGEAFEALAAGGINRNELMGKGLQFDAGGQFLGSAEQALNAVQQLVQEKYGKLAESMASGPAARMASVWDQVQRGVRAAGTELLNGFLPYLDLVGQKIGDWVKDGTFAKIGKTIADWFKPDGPVISGVLKFADMLDTAVYSVQMIGYGFRAVSNGIIFVINKATDLYNVFASLAGVMGEIATALGLGGAIGSLSKMPRLEYIDNPEPQKGSMFADAALGFAGAVSGAFSSGLSGAGKAATGSGSVASPGAAAIQEVASNTAELVAIGKRQLQLQEGALGGGSVGRVGIAAREMVDIRRRSRPAMVPG